MTGSGVTPERPEREAPLSPDQWRQLEPLLDVLLDTPPERRAMLFAKVSGGDPTRRTELERLVAECERAYPLLDQPAADCFAALVHTPPLQASQVVADRYRITRELGHGGMAIVYLARDLKHERDVALKVVRSGLAAALGSGRFLREIAIAARLRHPHIVPLYDSGEADGVLYYVMPYEPGPSLRERLRRDGPLPIDDAVLILREVCDALAYAHDHGVVHRDIKPDNVLLSGRHAMVADFGVAKALAANQGVERADGASDVTVSDVTTAGVVLGTPAYMAPEQIAGDPRVDHRADIYAVGVLAYEMLAGRPPFHGESRQEILAAHLAQAPAPVATHRPDVPAPLAELVMRCLEKRPGDRWQSAHEIVQGLHGLDSPSGVSTRITLWPRRGSSRTTRAAAVTALSAIVATLGWMLWPPGPAATPAPTPPALAVLVFQHGPDDGLDELAIALTRNLIGALGDVPHLSVRSLQAVWPYRNGQTPLDSVGRRLGVPWIVGGRVDRIGDQNVVSVELTDATTGRRLDGRQAVGAPGNDKDLVETLVPNVAALLRGRIGDHVRLEGWRARTRSGEAFASVNRAYRDVREADVLMAADAPGARLRLRRADSALEQASRADPAWAEPHIQRAWIARKAAFMLGPEGLIADSVVATLGRGVEHAAAARRVAPGDPRAREVHGVLLHGMSVVLRSKASAATLQAEAETLLREATDADSTLPRALNTLSSIHYARGELEQARLMAARAYAADAYSEDAQQLLARLFTIEFDDANDEEARRWCGEYARMFRNDWFTGYCRLMLMAWDSTAVPDADEAWRIARAATAAAPDTIRAPIEAQLQTLVAGVLARLGPTGGAEPVLAAVSAARTADPAVAREPFGTDLLQLEAGVRLRLGQPEIAIALLRDYLERHPGSPERLARGRRFRDVPVARLRDAVSQPR